MIRAFLFDIGNVLLTFDFGRALDRLSPHCGVADRRQAVEVIDRFKALYEDGAIPRAAFLEGVFEGLQYRGSEAQFIQAWEEIFEPNEPMLLLLEKLHGRFPLYLLSNTSEIHREYVFRQYPFLASFDAGIYSYAARASKPGRAIFETAIRELQLEPDCTYFIDDLLPNVETARALGFHTWQYDFTRHQELLADLQRRGVL